MANKTLCALRDCHTAWLAISLLCLKTSFSFVQGVEAAKATLNRHAEQVRNFLAGVEQFRKKADAEIAGRESAGQLQEQRKPPPEPGRQELDRQLRAIAQKRAFFPDGPIRSSDDIGQQAIRGKILGYTQAREEALFERRGGDLVRLDRERPP